jgi:hypothetical protein
MKMADSKDQTSSGDGSERKPPSTTLERLDKTPGKGGQSGISTSLQPGGVIPGGGPAGAGADDMGKAGKKGN